MNNYEWLAGIKCCSLSFVRDEHNVMYRSVADELDGAYYDSVTPEDRAEMIAADTICTLHIYINTPVGFNSWHAASLDKVIQLARTDLEQMEESDAPR